MKRLIFKALLLVVPASFACGELADSQIPAVAKQSIFTFEGTIKVLNKSNVPNVSDLSKSLIVSVDNVKTQTPTASKAFGSWIGKEITVLRGSDSATNVELKVGDRATFYTKPFLYADNVAVSAIGITKGSASSGCCLGNIMAMAAEEKANDLLKAEVSNAEAVVTGKVTNVRSLTEPKMAALKMMNEKQVAPRVSEHDPKWQEAVISVQAVGKGEPQKEVVVIFPGSDDRMWDRAPKFQKGQVGTWILHKNQIKNPSVADVLLARETDQPNQPTAYTTLNNEDFHPADVDGKNQARIQRAIEETRPK